MLRSHSFLSILIWLGFLVTLPIDTLTGYALNSGLAFTQLSILLKGGLIFMIMGHLLVHDFKLATLVFIGMLLFLFPQVYHSYALQMDTLEPLLNAVKILFPFIVLLFIYLEYVIEKKAFNVSALNKKICTVLNVYITVFLFNMLLGVMGFGFSTYSNNIGISGMFYAGNEVAGLFIVLSGYTLTQLKLSESKLYWLASVIICVTGILIGTKSAMLGAFLLVIMITLFGSGHNSFSVKKVLFIFGFLVLALAVLIYVKEILIAANLWDKFIFIYERQGLLGIIFSNRNVHLSEAFTVLLEKGGVLDYIFGFGQNQLGYVTGKNSIEMDPFDLYFWYGISGILIFALWLIITFSLMIQKDKTQYSKCTVCIMLCLIGMSIFSGHIFISGMIGIPLALVIGKVLIEEDKNQ